MYFWHLICIDYKGVRYQSMHFSLVTIIPPPPPTGVTVGLEFRSYAVNEGDGSIEVCAVLLDGNLQRTLMVNLSTQQNSNAQGGDI